MSDLDEEEIEATKKLQELSADEMFDELGYKISKNNNKEIEFTYCEETINFWLKEKEVSKDIYGSIDFITIDELKAINKKCKELGWIE